MSEIYLIGLGNPGKKYSQSRHNIGFLLLENLANKYNSNFLLKEKLKVAEEASNILKNDIRFAQVETKQLKENFNSKISNKNFSKI